MAAVSVRKIAKHLACCVQITIAKQAPIYVFGLLARNENHLLPVATNELAVLWGVG